MAGRFGLDSDSLDWIQTAMNEIKFKSRVQPAAALQSLDLSRVTTRAVSAALDD